MIAMGTVKCGKVTLADVFDRGRNGVREGPGNLEGSCGFMKASEEARFAPHVVTAELSETCATRLRDRSLFRSRDSDLLHGCEQAAVLWSSSTFGELGGKLGECLTCEVAEGFRLFDEDRNAYLRFVDMANSHSCCFPPGGPLSDCHVHSFYFSHQGAVTNLHYDYNLGDGLIIQLHGRKRVHLLPPQATKYLRPFSGTSEHRRSAFDGDLDNEVTQTEYVEGPHGADWQNACHLGITIDVLPGDALVIPMCWWHAVKSLDEPTVSLISRWNTPTVWTHITPFAAQKPTDREVDAVAAKQKVLRYATDYDGSFLHLAELMKLESGVEMFVNRMKHVKLIGLKSKRQLNGQRGTVVLYDVSTERYGVKLEAEAEIILVKLANLSHGTILERLRVRQLLFPYTRVATQFWTEPQDIADQRQGGNEQDEKEAKYWTGFFDDQFGIVVNTLREDSPDLDATAKRLKRVELVGLQSQPALNGQMGTVTIFDESKDRYLVKLDTQPKTILVKASNLSHCISLEALRVRGLLFTCT